MVKTGHTLAFVSAVFVLLSSIGQVWADTEHDIQGEGIVRENAKLEVIDVQDGVTVDTGAMQFELRHGGILSSLYIGDKALVADNDAPLLTASVLESEEYDGWSDYAPGNIIEATYQPAEHEYTRNGGEFRAKYTGSLDFGAGDSIGCEITLIAFTGSPFLRVEAQLTPNGQFKDRFIRSVAVRMPLALNKRKRVVQAGDRGVQWNTRHWYQYHVGPTMKLMNEPEHNIWRHFAIDQNTDGDYHIWRSESTATSSLTMQRGTQAPGWMAVYDEQAGVLFAYQNLTRRAPKSLRVMADDSGEAMVYLWHPGLSAIDVNSPQAQAVFGDQHITDWMAFAGEFPDSRPDVALAKHWGVQKLVSDPPARNEIPLANLNLLDAPAADADAPLVSGGVPLPKGALADPANVRLRHDGLDVPLQARPLAYWPDKSIKWLLLTFPPDGGDVEGADGEGDVLSFDLTRRDGSLSIYRLEYGGSAKIGTPKIALNASQNGDNVSIDTGILQLELAAPGSAGILPALAENWLRSVKFHGKDVLANDGARSFVDFLRTEEIYPCNTTHGNGDLDDGGFVPESIKLEEAGPLRSVVRLQGMTTSREPMRVIVRLEAYAGRSVVRVFQTVEFLHKDPRNAFVRRMGMELPLASTQGARVTVGGQDGPITLGEGVRAGLKQHSHLGYRAWHQSAGENFLRFDEVKHRSRGWLDISGSQGGVAVVMRDMWQQFPNELMVDTVDAGRMPALPEGGKLVAYFWPESEPLMDVRRYSNYPHRSVGESVPSDTNWINNSYYAKDAFVGVSRTHEILLYFHGNDVSGEKIDAVAADFQRPPLVYAGADWYINTGVLLPQPLPDPGRFSRVEANMDHFARFWMRHQKVWGWYGIWDYGDIQHHYKTGYGWVVPPDKLVELLQNSPEDYEEISVSKWRRSDYAPNHEWAIDNGRWGWSNTEGLPGLYMQNQYMRTGDRDIYFFVETMARHVRDVDMRHDGIWYGRGTRHGVQHWSDGNHEERQTTHSEFRYHHYLSGDMVSRDFAQRLYSDIYSKRDVRIHAAHSGRLQGLLTWWEMTGGDEVSSILEKYIPCFVVDNGICESPRVDFPEVKCGAQSRDINNGNMFFWTFGAGHGVLEYYYLTGHQGLRDALIKVADHAITRSNPGNFRKAVAFAARNADNPAPYREYLEEWAKRDRILVQVVPHNPDFYTGPRSMLQGNMPGSMFTMNDVTYILTVLEGDPELAGSRWEEIKRVDREGDRFYSLPDLSWQSEYDRPELEEYLRIKNLQP